MFWPTLGPAQTLDHIVNLLIVDRPNSQDLTEDPEPVWCYRWILLRCSLNPETGSLQAVISKHSLIHTPADLVPAALDDFARVLMPGGLLFLSFFGSEDSSTHGEGFDHAITTAYQLDIEIMAKSLTAAGFTEEVRIVRQPREGERQLPHGTFVARR